MKVLRGTLTFILGMIIGIILFVVAIGGTVVALGMAFKVGDLQSKFTDQEIISHESNLYDQTMLDAVKGVIDDVRNFDQLSLEKLYQHYGIAVLNGIGGIDFKGKDFYSASIKDIMGDASIVVNSFTLRDVSALTGNDFESYNLPILTDNLDNNIKGALDNILGSIKGDLTVRTIKTKLIPDFNVENNLIKAVQDIPFSSFGSAVNAFKLCTFLDVNTDTFVPEGAVPVFVKDDRYEEVSKADLRQKAAFVYADGVETYNADVEEKVGADDKKEYRLIERELRFVKKEKDGEVSYVVDNSCYGEDFDADATETKFYRHVEYSPYNTSATYPAGTEFFVKGFANRLTSFDNDATPAEYELYFKGFLSLKDVFVAEGTEKVELNGKVTGATISLADTFYKKGEGASETFVQAEAFSVKDEPIKKNSKLAKKEAGNLRATYLRVHEGTSKPLIQSFAYLTISELQDMDDFVDNVTIGDVIEVTDSSSKILKALKDTKFGDISTKIDTLTIDEVIDVVFDEYTVATDGEYVYIASTKDDNFVLYNAKRHAGMQRYARTGDSAPYVYTPDADGEYVKNGYFAKYVAADHAGLTRYNKNDEITNASSLIMQALALRGAKTNQLGTVTDDLCIYEVVDMAADDTSKVMKALAKRDCKIKEIGSVIDDLYIDEVIDINDESSLTMKSLAKRKCKIKDLGKITDELSLAETMEIKLDNFIEDANGTFVCIEDAESYIPYDENKHLGWTRFVKVDNVWEEYDELDPDHEGLVQFVHGRYYTLYNPAVHTAYEGAYYVREEVEGSSSKVLQRFANTTLGKFTDAFKALILGDVLKIDADRYVVAEDAYISAHPDEQYFYYESTDGVYLIANDEYRTAHPGDTFYRIAKSGKDKKIIKKLAYAKVDNLSSAIDKIMDDMFLSDLIDIYDHHQVEESDSLSDNKFIVKQHGDDVQLGYVEYDATIHTGEVRYNYVDGEYIEAANGKYVYVYSPTTFVKDSNGKYIKSPIEFKDVNRGDLDVTESAYVYVPVNGNLDPLVPADVLTFKGLAESGNVYYWDDTDYLNNVTLCTYLFANNNIANLYYRENCAVGTGNPYYQFNDANLFVKVLGNFIAYDKTNPAHFDMIIYALQTSPYVAGDESDYKYFVRYDEYKGVKVGNDGSYYTYDMSGTALSTTNKYSRQYCETIYLKCNDLTLYPIDQYFVFIDGNYVQYDEEEHAGMDTFIAVQAFLATEEQVDTLDASEYTRVHVIHEKSSAVLRMMKEKQVTMKNMSSIIADATIDDLMDVTPDSMFGADKIKTSTIKNLGNAMSNMMNEMTIVKLLDWANITSIDPKVKSAIGDSTLTAFFTSLTYQNGAISVNMLKLYGLE